MAVPVVESVSAVAETATSSLQLNAPSGVVAGDLLVMTVVCRDRQEANAVSGWTNTGYVESATVAIGQTTYHRVADGTSTDTPAVTFSSAPSTLAWGIIHRVSGHDGVTAYVSDLSGFASSLSIPTTTAGDNESLCLAVGSTGSFSVSSGSWSSGWAKFTPDANVSPGYTTAATQSSDAGTTPSGTVSFGNSGRIVISVVVISPASGDPPVSTVPPLVTGDTTEDGELETTNGTWTGTETITYTYQWFNAEDDEGTGAAAIDGATLNTYTTLAGDVGLWVACRVTATNDFGSDFAFSNWVGPIGSGPSDQDFDLGVIDLEVDVEPLQILTDQVFSLGTVNLEVDAAALSIETGAAAQTFELGTIDLAVDVSPIQILTDQVFLLGTIELGTDIAALDIQSGPAAQAFLLGEIDLEVDLAPLAISTDQVFLLGTVDLETDIAPLSIETGAIDQAFTLGTVDLAVDITPLTITTTGMPEPPGAVPYQFWWWVGVGGAVVESAPLHHVVCNIRIRPSIACNVNVKPSVSAEIRVLP
jgi:hypothetical protein